MPTLIATDASNQCSITNNSGKDIIVTLNVPTNEAIDADAIANASGTLEVLLTTDGKSVIKSGSSGTVTLDHTYKPGGDVSGGVHQYDLTISDSNWLYPLAVCPVVQQVDNGTTGYAAQTIRTDNTAMTQAAIFYQTLIAYPASGLAKDYATALQAAQNAAATKADGSPDSAAAAADAMEHAMDGFFKNLKGYEQVTLADVVAIDSYYNNLPTVWSQYKDSLTYYLYGSDGTTAGFAGSLSLTKSGAVDITKPNAGYTCTFAPASNPADKNSTTVDATKATTLSYVDGAFTDDGQSIALRGAFILLSSLTGKDSDNKIIMVLTGNVKGTSCVGFDAPQTAPAKASLQATATGASSLDRYWDVLIHPKNQEQLIISVMTLVGAVLLLPAIGAAVYGVYRVIKYKAAAREAVTRQIVEHTRAEFEEYEQQGLLGRTNKMDGRFGQWVGDFFIEFNPANIEGIDRALQNDTLANKLIKALKLQREGLEEALKYSAAMKETQVTSINKSLETIKDSIGTLTTSRRTELETVLPKQLSNYKEVTRNVMDVYFNLQTVLSADARTLISENSDISQQISKDVEDSFNADANEVKNEDPVPEDHYSPFE